MLAPPVLIDNTKTDIFEIQDTGQDTLKKTGWLQRVDPSWSSFQAPLAETNLQCDLSRW